MNLFEYKDLIDGKPMHILIKEKYLLLKLQNLKARV